MMFWNVCYDLEIILSIDWLLQLPWSIQQWKGTNLIVLGLYILLNLIVLYNSGILIVMCMYYNNNQTQTTRKKLVLFLVLIWFGQRNTKKRKQKNHMPAIEQRKNSKHTEFVIKLCKDIA